MIQKTQLKINGQNHHKGDKKERPKDAQPVGTKIKRES
jgi:hypothetical protein